MGFKAHKTNSSCAKCGACTAVCPVFQVTGKESLTARGRFHLLEKNAGEKLSGTYLDIFSKCLLCGACQQTCPRGMDLPTMLIESRSHLKGGSGQMKFARALIAKCLPDQRIMTGISRLLRISAPLLAKLPADSGLRLKLGMSSSKESDASTRDLNFMPFPATINAQSMLFTGCFARYLDQSITTATIKLVSKSNNAPAALPPAQSCCGLAFYSSGNLKEARRLARLNISAFEENQAPIIVLCGSCFSHLAGYPDLLADDDKWHQRAIAFADRLQEFSAFLNDRDILPNNTQEALTDLTKTRAVYHTPCHLRHRLGHKEAVQQLLNKLPWLELIHPPHANKCCGFGGLFNLAHPDISKRIGENVIKEILTVSPDLVTTTCTGCLIQLRQHLAAAESRIRVMHLAQVLTENNGLKHSRC